MSDERNQLPEDSAHDPNSAQPRDDLNSNNYEKQSHGKEVLKGILLLALLHVLLVVFPFAYFAIGVAQLIYLIPAVIIALVKKRVGIAQGLILGGVITFLLNAACFGLISISNF